jgi:hypothetical protein
LVAELTDNPFYRNPAARNRGVFLCPRFTLQVFPNIGVRPVNSTLHLVEDEVVRLNKRDRFRMQIWRGAERPPVVMFIGIPKNPAPDFYTCRLANIALRNYLHYKLPVPIIFHYSVWEGKARAFKVDFDLIGHPLRPLLTEAKYTKVSSDAVERVFHIPARYQPKESK